MEKYKLILKKRKFKLPYHIYTSFFEDYENNPDIYEEFIKISRKVFFTNKKFKYYFSKKIYPCDKKQFAISCNHINYVPKTFTLISEIINYREKLSGLWFIKPDNSSCGKGITVVNNIIKYANIHKNESGFIYQKAINNLLLYNKKKQDIRIYLLIHSYKNKIVCYLFKNGITRFSSENYNENNLSKEHQLTNTFVFKGDVEDSCENFSEHPYYDELFTSITNVVTKVCKVLTKNIKYSNKHYFHFFGLDFVPDNNFNTWLIEINDNPIGIYLDDPKSVTDMKRDMIINIFELIINPILNNTKKQLGNFNIIYKKIKK
jgi:hypothetical protein